MSENHMHRIEGGCHCGNIHVVIELTQAPGDYCPRACDCDFCRKHGASYVSDPLGTLHIVVEHPQFLGRYRQGGEIAEFLFCTSCGVLVGVVYEEHGSLYAAVNSAACAGDAGFGDKQSISPKRLTASEKIGRWKALWFSQVTLSANDTDTKPAGAV